jgi:SAM-dependent methyltransferase
MNTGFDQTKAESFAGRMMSLINNSSLSLLVSIGAQTGLFETMQGMSAATSEEIAKAAGLQERYVREWLGGMVVGRIVEFDPEKSTYRLPPEHAAFLTQAAGINNLGVFTKALGMLSSVESDVIHCFHHGGGVGYEKYPHFQQFHAEMSGVVFDSVLIPRILPLVDGLVNRLQAGIEALDIGTGQGHAVNLMAREFPKSRFVGIDLSSEGVQAAQKEAAEKQLSNATFEVADASSYSLGRYDLITAFDVIHDLPKPKLVLKKIAQTLKPSGVFLMMDASASSCLEDNLNHPLGPMLYTASVMHCMTVSLSQNGEGLGIMWGEQVAQRYLKDAGFSNVQLHHLEGDPMHVIYIAQR